MGNWHAANVLVWSAMQPPSGITNNTTAARLIASSDHPASVVRGPATSHLARAYATASLNQGDNRIVGFINSPWDAGSE